MRIPRRTKRNREEAGYVEDVSAAMDQHLISMSWAAWRARKARDRACRFGIKIERRMSAGPGATR